jgi:lipid II:glycine glycyltransferase (peptidoglycan interpeptide bridge formation enzyme)
MSEKTNSYTISILTKEQYPLWNKFVKNSPQGTFFNSTEWANILSLNFNRPFKIAVCSANDKIQAGMLLFENTKMGFNFCTPVFLYPFSGPLFRKFEQGKIHKAISDKLEISEKFIEYLQKKYRYWTLDTFYSFDDIRPFQWKGCQVNPVYTYQINLQNSRKLFDSFNRNTKYKIRQIEKMNPEIYESRETQEFIRLYDCSYKRHGLHPPVNLEVLQSILKMVLDLEQFRLYYLRLEDKTLAGRIICLDKKVVYALISGVDAHTGNASAYLMSEILQRFNSSHVYFDFLGADHSQVEQFKRGFGGNLVHRFRIKNKVKFPFSLLVKIREGQLQYRRKL